MVELQGEGDGEYSRIPGGLLNIYFVSLFANAFLSHQFPLFFGIDEWKPEAA